MSSRESTTGEPRHDGRNRVRVLRGIFGVRLWLLGGGVQDVAAGAPAKPPFHLKLLGVNRTLDPWKLYEEWATTVERRRAGRGKCDCTSLPELGLGGAEQSRVLKTATVDSVETDAGFMAGALPLLEILE